LITPKIDKVAIVRPRNIPKSPHKRSIFFRDGLKNASSTIMYHHLKPVCLAGIDTIMII